MKSNEPAAVIKMSWYRKMKIAGILCTILSVGGFVITIVSGATPNILPRICFSGTLLGIVVFLLGRAIERKMKFNDRS